MLSCKDISRLVTESFERKLSVWERTNLWMHIGLCGPCRMFRRFQVGLHRLIRGRAAQGGLVDAVDSEARLSNSARERIGAAMVSHLDGDDR